jgi:two-component sensor histidine kinase
MMEEKIAASLNEKETLLREIHHRVKNNLQIISSLLSMQIRQVDHPRAVEVLLDSQNREKTMSLVHEHLYQADDNSLIDLEYYLKSLMRMLFQSHQCEGKKILFEISVYDVLVDINAAIPLGLITNEIITNSLKYAFKEKEVGNLSIAATESSDSITFVIADDGIGIGDIHVTSPGTLGLRLIHGLTHQLRANMVIDGQNGTTFTFVIPKDASQVGDDSSQPDRKKKDRKMVQN